MFATFNNFPADALNTQRSESTKKAAFEIVLGQKPNRLCEISDKTGPLLEEDLTELFKDQDFSQVTIVESLNELREGCSSPRPSTPKSILQESNNTHQTIDLECLDHLLKANTCREIEEETGSLQDNAYDHKISKNNEGYEVLPNRDTPIDADVPQVQHPIEDDGIFFSSDEEEKVGETSGTTKNVFETLLAKLRDGSETKDKRKVTISDSHLLDYVEKSISTERIAGIMTGKEILPSYSYNGKIPDTGQTGHNDFIHYLENAEIYEDELTLIRDHILKCCKKENGLFLDGDKVVSLSFKELLSYIEHTERLPAKKDVEAPAVNDSRSNTAIFPVTSPRRKRIRDKVVQQGLVNADKMIKKYAKRKRIIVEEFQVGENVSVKIPKQDRIASDNKRLPCVIVDKRGGPTSSYRLVCSSGTIDRRVTASDIMRYPGRVEIDENNLNKRISLRQAAREASVIKANTLSCKCKKGCTGKTCVCRKAGKICSSRCHKGISCKNNQFHQLVKEQVEHSKDPDRPATTTKRSDVIKPDVESKAAIGGKVSNEKYVKEKMKDLKAQNQRATSTKVSHGIEPNIGKNVVKGREPENLVFPSYGGHIVASDGSKMILQNTCRLDSWFAVIRILWKNNQEKMQTICKIYKESFPNSVNILHLIELEQYLQAKAGAALIMDLKIVNHSIDFYGNENEGFMKMFGFLFRHVISSSCDSKYCPDSHQKTSLCSFPTITTEEKVTKMTLSQEVNDWLFNRQQSVCGRKLSKAPPDDDLVFWDVQLQERSTA